MKVKKIETTLPLKVQGQACTNNCEEKIWAGKKEADPRTFKFKFVF